MTITDKYMEQFNFLLLNYYNTGAAEKLKQFLYENAIEPEQLPALLHDFGLLQAGAPEGGVGA